MKAKPMCAVCGKPVDTFTEEEGELDMVWTVRCHGDSDRIRLTKEQLRYSKVVNLGLAFDKGQRRLPDPMVGTTNWFLK